MPKNHDYGLRDLPNWRLPARKALVNIDQALAELGIDRSALAPQIKTAFRKEAMQRHPDRNLGVQTTDAMQTLNRAFDVVMAAFPFDCSPPAEQVPLRGSTRPASEFDAKRHDADMADVERRANFRPGLTAHVDAHLSLLQAAWGAVIHLRGVVNDLCQHCGGAGSLGIVRKGIRNIAANCSRCGGTGVEGDRRWSVDFTSPVGATHGQVVVIPGMGGRSAADHLLGDLRVRLQVHPQAGLNLMHGHLTSIATVSVWQWLLGGAVSIMTLEGVNEVHIKPGQRALELPGKGWPHPDGPSSRGGLSVMIRPVLPQSLTDEQRQIIARFAAEDRTPEMRDVARRLADWNAKVEGWGNPKRSGKGRRHPSISPCSEKDAGVDTVSQATESPE